MIKPPRSIEHPVCSSFQSKVMVDLVSTDDDRPGWVAMLDFSSNMTSARKVDRSDVSTLIGQTFLRW